MGRVDCVMIVTNNEGMFPDRRWICMGMKAGIDNKGEWLAWGIDRIYEEINKGIPGWGILESSILHQESLSEDLRGVGGEATNRDVGCNPWPRSPFAPSFGDNTFHPPIYGGLQDRVPTLSLLRNEGTIKQDGEFLHLEFLFSGGGGGGSVRGCIGTYTRTGTNNTI